jgi:hypothetical protein
MNESRANVRDSLLEAALWFVRAAAQLSGVRRIAFVGSILSRRQRSKDIDLLVYVADDADLVPLASTARRLQGRLQSQNRGADVFLADEQHRYWGRTCSWKLCQPGIRASCDALHCGAGGRISMTTWRQLDSLIRSSRHRPLTSGPPSCADARYLPMSRRW